MNGTVEFVDGEIVFTPTPNFDGLATFEYEVTDGIHGSDIGLVRIDVESTNQAPQTGDHRFDGFEDTAYIIDPADLLGNNSDPDGDDFDFLSFAPTGVDLSSPILEDGVVTYPNAGNVTKASDGTYSFTPRGNFNGEVAFTYTITDGRLNSREVHNLIIDFAPVNDDPDVTGESGFTKKEDEEFNFSTVDLLANDDDVDGDPLTIVSVQDFMNGIAELENGVITFTPRADYFGNAGFSYRVSDGNGGFADGFVELTVTPVEDAPVALDDDGIGVFEDGFIDIPFERLRSNDSDADGNTLMLVGVTGDGVSIINSETLRFMPSPDQYGEFSFTYEITDGNGGFATATVTVNVLPVDDDPSASDDVVNGVAGRPLTIPIHFLTGNDDDVDGHAISITDLQNAVGGSVAFDGAGNIVFTPDDGRTLPGSFDYVLTDTTGATDIATVTANLDGLNNAPVLVRRLPDQSFAEDTAVGFTLPADAFLDLDNDALTLSAELADGSALPDWLAFDADAGSFAGTPPENYNGSLEVVVSASDGEFAATDTFRLAITAVNDAPEVTDAAVQGTEDQILVVPILQLLGEGTDVDGDRLSITSLSSGTGIQAELDGAGNIALTFEENFVGDVSFDYTVSDGTLSDTAQVTVNVAPQNDAPTIRAIADVHRDEDTAIEFEIPAGIASDLDGDAVELSATRASGVPLPAWLTFDAATRRFTGTPPANFFGTIALAVVVSDGAAEAASIFDLVIEPVNDIPTLSGPFSDRFIDEDERFDVKLQSALAGDVDGDQLTFDVRLENGDALPAWLSFDAARVALTGMAPPNFKGEIDLRVFISDGQSEISDEFLLTVRSESDAPVVLNPLEDILVDPDNPEDGIFTGESFSIEIPADTFEDPDNDPLQFAALLGDGTALPSWLNFDGSVLSGKAPPNGAGTYEVEIRATDGIYEASDTFLFTVQEGSTNAAPVAHDDGVFDTRGDVPILISPDRLLANDVDPDGDQLKIVSIGNGVNGTITVNANDVIVYTANDGFTGEDQFEYAITDGRDVSIATVKVRVDEASGNGESGEAGGDGQVGDHRSDTYLNGGGGGDLLIPGRGNNAVIGGAGNESIFSGAGNGIIRGGGDGRAFATSADSIINGSAENDILSGGNGDDLLFGGRGSDSFAFKKGDGSDAIIGYEPSRAGRRFNIEGDKIHLSVDGIDSFHDLLARGQENDGGTVFDFGEGDEIFLKGTQLSALDRNDFTFF